MNSLVIPNSRWKSWLLGLLTALFCLVTPVVSLTQTPFTETEPIKAPVVLGDQTLFTLQQGIGELSVQERARTTSDRLTKAANDLSIPLSSLRQEEVGDMTNLAIGDQVLLTLTELDATAPEQTRQQLARTYLVVFDRAIRQYRQERSVQNLVISGLWTALATILLFLGLSQINKKVNLFAKKVNLSYQEKRLGIAIQNQQILNPQRVHNWLLRGIQWLKLGLSLIWLTLYVLLVLCLFPWTKGIGWQIVQFLGYTLGIFSPIFWAELLKLIGLGVVLFITAILLRVAHKFTLKVAQEEIKLEQFDPSWAFPTYQLARVGILALAFVLAYPFLPFIASPLLMGVFLLLLGIGLWGSRDFIQDAIAGFFLTYNRPYTLGDRVQIGDLKGTILEQNLFSVRLRTIKNEIVTLPHHLLNQMVVINYSTALREKKQPLLLHTTVQISYEVPWQIIHKVLLNSAAQTRYILSDPASFVLQRQLNSHAVLYELNAYTNAPTVMEKIYSELHQNIQDLCTEAQIELLTPTYTILRELEPKVIADEDPPLTE
ncbi:mechanosensitive ion channel family protein [Spirulina subsalsa FACHB-351]|uniref:Mechanosensitive ion channel family protein n=1 Tax=Spirulina subsalsa FACHB-351 TaxID=234711 RepID=A0ABT3L3L2_9CYAN|nr:mechanosensitive ion channel family protein [Spirulina subsalsa]MCW6036089.1 mechanosensitive ion channel family protein [Spirulina subsalsa FACHB-351]